MVAYRSRQITSQWIDGEPLVGSKEFTDALFATTFAFIDTRKEQVLRAYLSGELNYDYYRRRG
jgi:hypothetical protein